MSKRRRLTPDQVARLAKLRDQLSSANPDTLLPKLTATASARLRAAALPATFEQLQAWEEFADGSGGQSALARIADDHTVSPALRHCAEIVWYADAVQRRLASGDAASTFAMAARLLGNVTALIMADDAPTLEVGRKVRRRQKEAATLAARSKAASREARYAELRRLFRDVQKANPRLSDSAAARKVAAAGRASVSTVLRAAKGPSRRK